MNFGFSKFDIPHRVMVQASYNSPKYWNGWTSTTISVIYNGFSGSRYSLTMNEKQDFNGDGFSGNSLLYIPTDEELSKMVFTGVDKNGETLSMTAEESRAASNNGLRTTAMQRTTEVSMQNVTQT